MAASDIVHKTNVIQESNFRSAFSISDIKQTYTKSSGVSKQPLASSTSFRQPSGVSKQPFATSREPLSNQSRSEPVMTDFAKKFLLNRKWNYPKSFNHTRIFTFHIYWNFKIIILIQNIHLNVEN